MNAVLTSGNAVAVVFDSISSKLNARTVDPSALLWSNHHDPSDSLGTGSSGNGTQVTARPLNAGAAPSSNAAPPTKAAPPVSPTGIRRLATANRVADAPYPPTLPTLSAR